MKRIMAMLLVIALFTASFPVSAFAETRIEYFPVEAVLGKIEDLEKSYREWASQIIKDYYFGYAMHTTDHSQYDDFEFDRNFLDQYQGDYVYQFDGIYRGYYMASIIKEEFDFNEAKSDYTVVMPDANSEEWKAQQKEFYMLLLAETINEKLAINPNAFDDLDVGQKGMYTLKPNPTTGMMEMVYDENGVMGNLEEMADAQVEEAALALVIDAIDFGANAAYGYFKAKKDLASGKTEESGLDLTDTLAKGCITGIAAVFERLNSTAYDNKINQFQNNITSIHQAYIANSMLNGSQRIIGYLERVYRGEDASFTRLYNDPIFLDAVNELIAQINREKVTESEAEAKKAVEEWYSANDINFKEILTGADIFSIIAVEVCTQAATLCTDVIQKALRSVIANSEEDETHSSTERLISLICDSVLSVLEPYIKDYANAYYKLMTDDGNGATAPKLDFNVVVQKVCQNSFQEIAKIIKEIGKETKNSDAQAMGITIAILSSGLADLVTLFDEADGDFTEQDYKKLASGIHSMLDTLLTEAFKQKKDDWINSLLEFDPLEYVEEHGEEALAEKLKNNPKIKKAIELAVDLKDKALDVSKSGANLAYMIMSDVKDEKQDSYRAKSMYAAYAASSPIERDLEIAIGLLVNNQADRIPAVILDSGSSRLKDVHDITDKIQLQVEYDLVGARWLIEILGLNEAATWFSDSEFYEFLKHSTKDTSWAKELTKDVAAERYDDMFNFSKGHQASYQPAFDLLFQK